jgi:hypothetical protein
MPGSSNRCSVSGMELRMALVRSTGTSVVGCEQNYKLHENRTLDGTSSPKMRPDELHHGVVSRGEGCIGWRKEASRRWSAMD